MLTHMHKPMGVSETDDTVENVGSKRPIAIDLSARALLAGLANTSCTTRCCRCHNLELEDRLMPHRWLRLFRIT
jgi:hypothetical protein